MEWSGVVKVRYESMVMVRRALVGDLNMLCKHAFLAGPCAGIRGIRACSITYRRPVNQPAAGDLARIERF